MKSHEEWFFKAYHDLESAKLLLSNNLTDTAISRRAPRRRVD